MTSRRRDNRPTRAQRAEAKHSRAEFIKSARTCAASASDWLNRDEHLAFKVRQAGRWPLGAWIVVRVSEDTLQETAHADGPLPVAVEKFMCIPSIPCVYRSDDALVVYPDGDAKQLEPSALRWIWKRMRGPQVPGFGTVPVLAPEVRELLGQLAASDPV